MSVAPESAGARGQIHVAGVPHYEHDIGHAKPRGQPGGADHHLWDEKKERLSKVGKLKSCFAALWRFLRRKKKLSDVAAEVIYKINENELAESEFDDMYVKKALARSDLHHTLSTGGGGHLGSRCPQKSLSECTARSYLFLSSHNVPSWYSCPSLR